MLPYFWYILKVIICSGILFGYYWSFLRNKIFHQYNRFYLLSAMILSLLLPLLKIDFWQQTDTPQASVFKVLQAVSAGDEYMSNVVITANKSGWSFQQLYPLFYWMVSVVFFLVLVKTLFAIRSLLKKYPVQEIEKVSFVNTNDKSTPFSFFKYIFWNVEIDMNTHTGKQIFKHEVAHIQEKHTHDKLFVNILLIFFWCNPFFWIYRKELNMIHEFIADRKAVADSDTSSFAAMILQATYPQHRFELTNNFFYSPIKRRLLMLTKIDNSRISYFARLMVLPLAVLVFAAFTFKAKNNHTSFYHGKKITVVIDAGHGGKDAGASSADGVLEKDLTLGIAKKIKELNSNDAIEIVLTRTEDVYLNAQEKAAFAKSKNADLVISFHIDNGPKEFANTKTGMSVFVAKDEFANAGESKILASAIINEFSNNYILPVMPQPKQRQGSVWILQANICPSVLVEAGFMNNEKDMVYLQTEAAKETIAKNVLTAIEKYASANNTTNNILKKTAISLPNKEFSKDTLPNKNIAISVQKDKQPLFILDGVEADSNILRRLDPNKINSINVLKDRVAFDKYGEKGNNGVIEIILKKNEIAKAEQPQVAIALDKFSVLYIGIDNPVTIALPDIPSDRLLVSTNNSSIRGNNGKYIVRVTAVGEATITVSTIKNNQRVILSTQSFQIKRIPDPTDTDFPDELKGLYKLDSSRISELKQKNLVEQQNSAKLNDNEKRLQLQAINADMDKVTLERKMQEYEVQNVKQKILYEQQNSAKLDYAEKQLLAKNADAALEKAVVERKLNDQELYNLKQKLLLEQQNIVKSDYTDKAILYEKELLVQQSNLVFTKAEVSPMFTGGDEAWRKYLEKNLDPRVPMNEGWKAGKYTVIVKFIVRMDGTVSDVGTENYKGSKTSKHCISIIQHAPKWQPAIQNGKKVNAYKKQPITFVIEE